MGLGRNLFAPCAHVASQCPEPVSQQAVQAGVEFGCNGAAVRWDGALRVRLPVDGGPLHLESDGFFD